jgi:oligopeptide transport system permease protein
MSKVGVSKMSENKKSEALKLNDLDKFVLSVGESTNDKKGMNLKTRTRYRANKVKQSVAIFTKRHLHLIFVLRRILFTILTLFIMITLIFLIFRCTVDENWFLSDISSGITSNVGSPEYNALLQERLHQFSLDGSLWNQIWKFWYNILPFIPKTVPTFTTVTIDQHLAFAEYQTVFVYFGELYTSGIGEGGSAVAASFESGIAYSLIFVVVSLLFSFLIGVPLGFYSAWKKGRTTDKAISVISTFLSATPPIVITLIIYYISFFSKSHTSYASGTFDTKIMPMIVLILIQTPFIVASTKSYVFDELSMDYSKFALAKGMTDTRMFMSHIFRNVIIRIIRIIPIAAISSFCGTEIFVEMVWMIPGMSKDIVDAVNNNEYFAILGYVVTIATFGIILSAAIDLIASSFDYVYKTR